MLNEYKTRVHLFHCLLSFSPFPTSLAFLPRTPTPGAHRVRAPASHASRSSPSAIWATSMLLRIMFALDQLAQSLSITPFHGCGGLPTSGNRTNSRWRRRRRGLIDHLNELPRRRYKSQAQGRNPDQRHHRSFSPSLSSLPTDLMSLRATRSTGGTRSRETRFTVHRYVSRLYLFLGFLDQLSSRSFS